MKIFIVSLEGATDRRERISEQMAQLGAEFEFFDAVNGHAGLPEEMVDMPDDRHREVFRSRPLSPGEKGCYASHYSLWKKCLSLDEPIVILEDDCIPAPDFSTVLAALPELHKRGYDYIRLEHQYGECSVVDKFENLEIVFWHDNSSGTRGYAIAPAGAKKLLEQSQNWLCAVDNFIGESYRTKMPCFGVKPYAVIDGADFESSIQTGPKLKTPLYFKLTRELYRFYRFARMSLWNAGQWKKYYN